VLGLRLVKKTVNFDDPGTYHLYYGDEQGAPGTILTFFPWAHAAGGRLGAGETRETAFRVPAASLGFWSHRFIEKGVTHGALEKRFGDTVLPFSDPDGMHFALVGAAGAEKERAGAAAGFRPSTRSAGFMGSRCCSAGRPRPRRC
jgi:glyoxalase family protein